MTMDPLTSRYFNISASSGLSCQAGRIYHVLQGWSVPSVCPHGAVMLMPGPQRARTWGKAGRRSQSLESGEFRLPPVFGDHVLKMLEAVAGTGKGAVGGRGGPLRGRGRRKETQGRPSRAEVTPGEGAAKGASSPDTLPGGNWEGSAAAARYPGGRGWGSSGFPALTFQPPV